MRWPHACPKSLALLRSVLWMQVLPQAMNWQQVQAAAAWHCAVPKLCSCAVRSYILSLQFACVALSFGPACVFALLFSRLVGSLQATAVGYNNINIFLHLMSCYANFTITNKHFLPVLRYVSSLLWET